MSRMTSQNHSFRTFANQNSCLYHLCVITLLKILFIYKCWSTSSPMNKVTPSYNTSQHMHIVHFALLFLLLFLSIMSAVVSVPSDSCF